MPYPLAVAAPQIGALSETFIRRHMEDLLPGRTIVIVRESKGSYLGNWNIKTPYIATNHLHKKILSYPVTGCKQLLSYYLSLDLEIDVFSAIERFIRKNKIQVILGEYLNSSFDFFTVSKKLGIPYYAHAHGTDISSCLRQTMWREKYSEYNQAAGIITMSHVSRKRLIEFGFEASKIHVIPYGVDVVSSYPIRHQAELVRCLAVGRLVPKKAPLLLLESFRQAVERNPSLRLDYIGTGQLLEDAQRFLREFDLQQVVTLHGGQSPETVKEFMAAADIFLQHSIVDPATGDEEGLPVSILEAMAVGLPIIATRHAGIPEAVLDGETGFLVDEEDCETMGSCISSLAEDSKLRIEMGRQGWLRAQHNFTWKLERQRLLNVMGLDS